MIKAKEPTVTRRPPPPVLNGSKALKAKPKRKPKKAAPEVYTGALNGLTGERECPTCKRPFPMSPAERQRKRRAKLKKAKR